ncbi:MAG: hypothetical protein LBI47_03280 [Puniceicoccales bacterium]|jgi:hypothetical protein|nr:hypothetical protein [Puniceicoccales bacterium]
MKGIKRTQSVQDYGQVVARPVEEEELLPGAFPMEGVKKIVAVGGAEISITRSKVSDDALETHSVVIDALPSVIILRNPRVNAPTSWLEFTVENIANLPSNEIVQRLSDKGIFDASKLGLMLFSPGGHQIVVQIIDVIPGHRLLKLIGESLVSAHGFAHIFFEKNFFMGDKSQIPTVESLCGTIRAKCKPQSSGLSQKKVDGQAATLAQTMMETYGDEDRHREFENNLRNIVDLIFAKLPPPDMGNQMYWDNIRRATRDNADRFYGTDGEKKLKELQERFPVLSSTPKSFGTNRMDTGEGKENKEFRKVEERFPVSRPTPKSFGTNRENTRAGKRNKEFKKTERRFPVSRPTPKSFGTNRENTRVGKGNRQFKKGWRNYRRIGGVSWRK